MVAATIGIGRPKLQRCPHFGGIDLSRGELELGRHHSDDGARASVKPHLPAHNATVPTISTHPQPVRDHGHTWCTRFIIAGRGPPAENRINAQCGQQDADDQPRSGDTIGKRALDYATAAGTKNGMLTDSQCGFRVFSYRALKAIEPTDNGLSIESQMLMEAQETNLRIQEVNIDARYDLDGSTVTPGRHGSSVLGRIITLVSEKRPLLFFGVGGAALLLVASALGVIVLQTYYSTSPHQLAVGYMFIVVFLGIIGIITIFIGVTLNVLTRMSGK